MTRGTLGSLTVAVLLAACTTQPTYTPYAGPVAAPQVVYRIDAHRYFEVVPLEHLSCARARLYYTDTARGIHVDVASWDRLSNKGRFVIDAANEEYLVTPVVQSSPDCQTGDSASYLCADRIRYSQDAGRTWKATRTYSGSSTYLIGPLLFIHSRDYGGWRVSIAGTVPDDKRWEEYGASEHEPVPAQAPLDDHFHCDRNGKDTRS